MKYTIEIVKNEKMGALMTEAIVEGESSYEGVSEDMLTLPEILGCAYGHMLRDTVFKDSMSPLIIENFTKWMNAGAAFCKGINVGLNGETEMEKRF